MTQPLREASHDRAVTVARRFEVHTRRDLDRIPELEQLKRADRLAMKTVSAMDLRHRSLELWKCYRSTSTGTALN